MAQSALDDLLSDFQDNATAMPAVNPPEAPKVLAAQTAPEVAGEPEPPPADEAPPAPTEKPAEVKAAEAAKSRGKGKKAEPAPAAPAQGTSTLGVAVLSLDNLAQLAAALPKGVTITIQGQA